MPLIDMSDSCLWLSPCKKYPLLDIYQSMHGALFIYVRQMFFTCSVHLDKIRKTFKCLYYEWGNTQ
jgi:hypothetical protein